MTTRVKWTGREALAKRIGDIPPKMTRALVGLTEYHGMAAENAMRKNAPWRDQTSNARNGLHTTVTHNGNVHEIILAHGVSYGIWLEVRWAGRYQIILPTLQDTSAAVMDSLTGLMGKM